MFKKAIFIGLAVLTTVSTAVAFYSTVRYQDLVRQDNLMKKRVDSLEKEIAKVQKPPRPEFFQIAEDPDNELAPIWNKLNELEEAFKKFSAQQVQNAGGSPSQGQPPSGSDPVAQAGPSQPGSSQSGQTPADRRQFEGEIRKIVGGMIDEFREQRTEDRRKQQMDKLEKELGLTQIQKDFITNTVNQYREQVGKLFERPKPGDPKLTKEQRDQQREQRQQQVQVLQQETELKVLTVLDLSQQTKYQQLKASGEVRLFGGWGRDGGGGDRNQNRTPAQNQNPKQPQK